LRDSLCWRNWDIPSSIISLNLKRHLHQRKVYNCEHTDLVQWFRNV
jgi:hypothetical protein